MTRHGFALIAVLWVITVVGGAVGVSRAAVRLSHHATRNRVVLARARWAAEACVAIAQARWQAGSLPDTATVDLGRTTMCAWRVADPSTRLNLNTASGAEVLRLLHLVGVEDEAASRLAAALIDRRRSGPFLDRSALMDLPGFDPRLLPYVTVDGPGTINANAASGPVLRAVEGITVEVVERLDARRRIGRPIASLDELIGDVSPPAREQLVANYAHLIARVSFTPTHLLLSAEGWVGSVGSYPRATIELLVARLPDRLAVLRRRMS